MSFKDAIFYLVCAVTWFILLPLCLVGGTIALFGDAVFSELREHLPGRTAKTIDNAAAREMARRLCIGN